MGERPTILTSQWMGGLTVAAVAVIALVDLITPVEVNLAILYGVPLLGCALARRRRILWGLVTICCVLSYAAFFWKWGGIGRGGLFASLLLNRSLDGLVLLGTGGLLHYLIGTLAKIERGDEAM